MQPNWKPLESRLGQRALWLSSDIESTLRTLPYKRLRKAKPIPDLPFTSTGGQPKPKQSKGGKHAHQD